MYWSDSGTSVIRRLTNRSGNPMVETVAGIPRATGAVDGPALLSTFAYAGPQGLAFYGNNLYIADSGECYCGILCMMGVCTPCLCTCKEFVHVSTAVRCPLYGCTLTVCSAISCICLKGLRCFIRIRQSAYCSPAHLNKAFA